MHAACAQIPLDGVCACNHMRAAACRLQSMTRAVLTRCILRAYYLPLTREVLRHHCPCRCQQVAVRAYLLPLSLQLSTNEFLSCCLQVAVHEERSLNAKATVDRLMYRMDQLQLSERPRALDTGGATTQADQHQLQATLQQALGRISTLEDTVRGSSSFSDSLQHLYGRLSAEAELREVQRYTSLKAELQVRICIDSALPVIMAEDVLHMSPASAWRGAWQGSTCLSPKWISKQAFCCVASSSWPPVMSCSKCTRPCAPRWRPRLVPMLIWQLSGWSGSLRAALQIFRWRQPRSLQSWLHR